MPLSLLENSCFVSRSVLVTNFQHAILAPIYCNWPLDLLWSCCQIKFRMIREGFFSNTASWMLIYPQPQTADLYMQTDIFTRFQGWSVLDITLLTTTLPERDFVRRAIARTEKEELTFAERAWNESKYTNKSREKSGGSELQEVMSNVF